MKKVIPKDAFLIPQNAKLVFKGVIFDTYHWPQKMFDGTTQTFEMLKRPDTVKVIAIKDGQIVLLDEEQPGLLRELTYPGGRVEGDGADDTILAGAQREMLEETGMTFKTWTHVLVTQAMPQHIEGFFHWYVASDFISQGEAHLDAGERITVQLTSFDELKRRARDESELKYGWDILSQADTIEALLTIPEFEGQEVDR